LKIKQIRRLPPGARGPKGSTARPLLAVRSHERRRAFGVRKILHSGVSKSVIIMAWGNRWGYENRRLIQAIQSYGVRVKLCHPNHFGVTIGRKLGLTYRGKPIAKPNLILTRTGSATGSFADIILRQAELMKIRVLNPIQSIQVVMNKARTTQILAKAGLRVPLTHVYSSQKAFKADEWPGGFPCVVKILSGSHGNGVIKIENASQLKAYVGLLKGVKFGQPFIVQQFIGRPGEDLRIFIVNGEAVECMQRKATDGDFRAGISAKGEGSRFEMTAEIKRVSEAAAAIAGVRLAGVDILLDLDGTPWVSEINSAPGLAGIERYCNPKIAEKIAEFVAEELGLLHR
jgi:RimK family alpha-L-glutamate ligase